MLAGLIFRTVVEIAVWRTVQVSILGRGLLGRSSREYSLI